MFCFFLFAVSVECLLPLQKWYNASPYSASECRNRVSDRDLLSWFITIIFLSKDNQDWLARLGSKKKTHLVWWHSFKFIYSTHLESLKLDNTIKEWFSLRWWIEKIGPKWPQEKSKLTPLDIYVGRCGQLLRQGAKRGSFTACHSGKL